MKTQLQTSFLAIYLLVLFSLARTDIVTAQLQDYARGMYVNNFIKFHGDPFNYQVDPNLTILGNQQKENELLQYCKENGFTYILMYDLYPLIHPDIISHIDSRTGISFGDELCNFMSKAKNEYCITRFGAAGASQAFFSDVTELFQTPPIQFTPNELSSLGPGNPLLIAQNTYAPTDPDAPFAEFIKFFLRITSFNTSNQNQSINSFTGPCSDVGIEVITVEDEFWRNFYDGNGNIIATPADNYPIYHQLILDMDAIRAYHALNGVTIYVETYLAYLETVNACNWAADQAAGNCCASNGYQALTNCDATVTQNTADFIDQYCDRILLTYYAGNITDIYDHPTVDNYWHNNLYQYRFLDFGNNARLGTVTQPLFDSESYEQGGTSNYYGYWFTFGLDRNVFTAEKNWYNQWYADANPFAQDNDIKPGTSHWYSSQSLMTLQDNPVILQSNSPVCSGTPLTFTYQGPINQGLKYDFWIENDATTEIVHSEFNRSWPYYDGSLPANQRGIIFNSLTLLDGNYHAHLKVYYNNSLSDCSYQYDLPIVVSNAPTIQVFPQSTICDGQYIVLRASSGGTTYSWTGGGNSRDKILNGFTTTGGQPLIQNFTCTITGGTCPGAPQVTVTINPNENPNRSTSCTVSPNCDPLTPGTTIFANADPWEFVTWSDGTHGPSMHVSESGEYSIMYTQQNGGCTWATPISIIQPELTVASGFSNITCGGAPTTLTVSNLSSFSNGVDLYINGTSAGIHLDDATPTYAGATTGFWSAIGSRTFSDANIQGLNIPYCITSNILEVTDVANISVTNESVCDGDYTSIECNVLNATYLWTDPHSSGAVLTNRWFVVAPPPNTTVYTVNVDNIPNCPAGPYPATGTVTLLPLPTVTTNSNASSCGSSCTGTASVVQNGYTYLWSTGANSQLISSLCQGSYSVTVTDAAGCSSTATQTVGSVAAAFTCNAGTGDFNICTADNSSSISTIYQPGDDLYIHNDWTIDNDFTIAYSDVIIDPGVKIIILPGASLQIKNSHLFKCTDSWDGIYLSDASSYLRIDYNSTVEDAISAVNATNSARVDIVNSTFLNNQLAIHLHDGNFGSSHIYGNIFDFPSLPMYDFDLPTNIILLQNIVTIQIGDETKDPNIFANSYNGIASESSNFTLYNNSFSGLGRMEVEEPGVFTTNGVDVYAYGSGNVFNNITIGGPMPSQRNSFSNSFTCISIFKRVNADIENNYFGNTHSPIYVLYANDGIFDITNNELVSFANTGVYVYDAQNADINISDNYFNTDLAGTPYPYNSVNYGYKAIQVQNILTNHCELSCQNNLISNVRFGVHLRNLDGSQIQPSNINVVGNSVFYVIPQPDLRITHFHRGIWLENASNSEIRSNIIQWTDIPQTGDERFIMGISCDRSGGCLISENSFTNLGYGFRGYTNCPGTMLQCNSAYNCFNAWFFLGATFPPQGEPAHDLGWGNWFDMTPDFTANLKIDGDANIFQLDWWNNALFPEYNPNPYDPQVLFDQSAAVVGNIPTCNHPMPPPVIRREKEFGEIVRDEVDYPYQEDGYRILDEEYFYKQMKSDPSQLSLGGNDDSQYQQLYSSVEQSNLGKLTDALDYIKENSFSLATSKLQSMSGENFIESNKKLTLNTYLQSFALDQELTETQKQAIAAIGYLNAIEGGEAVYFIRAMLNLDLEDNLSALRKANPRQNPKQAWLNNGIMLFPNPTMDNVTVQYSIAESDKALLEIFDALGNKVIIYTLNSKSSSFSFSCSSLSPGLYQCKMSVNGDWKGSSKLVVIR